MGLPQPPTFLLLLIFFTSLPSLLRSQQPYQGLDASDCRNQHNSTSLLGYFCDAHSPSCRAYLTFHSQPPYQSVSTISALLASDPSQLSPVNSVGDATFPAGTKVIVPVNCSCSNGYYQSNSSYLVQPGDSAFGIASGTYQGLSTCQALQAQNTDSFSSGYLIAGLEITVPLRCACPTVTQRSNGVQFLLTYLIDPGETVFNVGQKFGIPEQSILNANVLSPSNASIYPSTTLLIPLKDHPNSFPPAITPPPPPFPSPGIRKSPGRAWAYLGIGFAVGALLWISSIALVCVLLKAKWGIAERVARAVGLPRRAEKPSNALKDRAVLSAISDIGHSLRMYRFEELQLATGNFCSEFRIEGSVFAGDFNGDAAAVKIMNREVPKEVGMHKKINHFNLVRLFGACFHNRRWYLVFEHARNGALSNWILDRRGSMVLSWTQRVRIALDVANGLDYLHSYTRPVYVHMDVKSTNILLDDKFRAKIANFGLARPVEGREGTVVSTTNIVGTIGYMAPEHLENGLVSPKLDVYAFGVVMMEIITGKKATDAREGGDELSLQAFIAVIAEEDAREKVGSFMDPLLEGKYPMDLALIMARLIRGCLRGDAGGRPSMGEISKSLLNICAASESWEISRSIGVSEFQSSGSERGSVEEVPNI